MAGSSAFVAYLNPVRLDAWHLVAALEVGRAPSAASSQLRASQHAPHVFGALSAFSSYTVGTSLLVHFQEAAIGSGVSLVAGACKQGTRCKHVMTFMDDSHGLTCSLGAMRWYTALVRETVRATLLRE